jgi:hypothetical protein
MEGNECYKFSTIKNYIERTREKDVEVILDIGANVCSISLMMKSYFPKAKIYAFEPVKEYYDFAYANVKHDSTIKLFNMAVSSQHLFADDLGEYPRNAPVSLRILKGLPEAGPGWAGGSVVLPSDHELLTNTGRVFGYEKISQEVLPITLEEAIKNVMASERCQEVDLIKIDCEGCEHSSIGCCDTEILKQVRYIVGEYHDINRFYHVMQKKLFLTHKVNLIGTRILGCFFAERLDDTKNKILKYDKSGMLISRPWLSDCPIDWHVFNSDFVLTHERHFHAL